MNAKITRLDDRRCRALSADERLQCLVLAKMNEEKAELCTQDQSALAAFFRMNAQLLHLMAAK